MTSWAGPSPYGVDNLTYGAGQKLQMHTQICRVWPGFFHPHICVPLVDPYKPYPKYHALFDSVHVLGPDLQELPGRDRYDGISGTKEGVGLVGRDLYLHEDGCAFLGGIGESWWMYEALRIIKDGLFLFKLNNVFYVGIGDDYYPLQVKRDHVGHIPFVRVAVPVKYVLVELVAILILPGKCGE